jgi:hypothetical protein
MRGCAADANGTWLPRRERAGWEELQAATIRLANVRGWLNRERLLLGRRVVGRVVRLPWAGMAS